MLRKIIAFGMTAVFSAAVSCSAWAALGEFKQKSVDEFSQGFQGMVDSTSRLETQNIQQKTLNDDLKQKFDLLQKNMNQTLLNNDQLEKELAGLTDQTKSKSDQIQQVDDHVKKFQEDIKKIEQEIALSKIAFAERQKQQNYLIQILTLAREQGTVHLDMKSVLENQEVLKQRVNYGNKRADDLQREWKELSFWYGDKNESLPELSAIKKQLLEKILEYQKLNVSDQWAQNHLEIKKNEQEIKELVFRHDLYRDMLKVLDNQFTGAARSKEAVHEERKLQNNLGRLKKENKQLQERVQNLRHQMVNLDKEKAKIERNMK